VAMALRGSRLVLFDMGVSDDVRTR
jgi:hypothetical protein